MGDLKKEAEERRAATMESVKYLNNLLSTKAKLKEVSEGITKFTSTLSDNVDWADKVDRQLVEPDELKKSLDSSLNALNTHDNWILIDKELKFGIYELREDLKRDYLALSTTIDQVKRLTETTKEGS